MKDLNSMAEALNPGRPFNQKGPGRRLATSQTVDATFTRELPKIEISNESSKRTEDTRRLRVMVSFMPT